jgi:molybdate-binding protein
MAYAFPSPSSAAASGVAAGRGDAGVAAAAAAGKDALPIVNLQHRRTAIKSLLVSALQL